MAYGIDVIACQMWLLSRRRVAEPGRRWLQRGCKSRRRWYTGDSWAAGVILRVGSNADGTLNVEAGEVLANMRERGS